MTDLTGIAVRLRASMSDGWSGDAVAADAEIAEEAAVALIQSRDEIERLLAALKPFADAVYNDNGDMTITPAGHDAYVKAYFVVRLNQQTPAQKPHGS
jgi:hypothetical protein